jgi:hypothetical protein
MHPKIDQKCRQNADKMYNKIDQNADKMHPKCRIKLTTLGLKKFNKKYRIVSYQIRYGKDFSIYH